MGDNNILISDPVIFFYNAVKEDNFSNNLSMATCILEGIKEQLGFLPDIMGAGLMGDHIWTPTKQFVGEDMEYNSAFALTFSDDIHIDHVFLHGCRPSSPYYEITKSRGTMILEIEGKPALDFMDEILGDYITPEEYPLFLIMGKNFQGLYQSSNWKDYAIRFCKDIERDLNAIIMFEPDMVTGTKFQIMTRTQGFDYMREEIDKLLISLEGREPIFGFYINCAGRCAAYGGVDIEDGYVIQDLIGNKFPLFGIYTAAEIASFKGRPEMFYWTGVLCLFFKGKKEKTDKVKQYTNIKNSTGKALSYKQLEELSTKNMAQILSLDKQNIAIRNELEQKRRGFSLIADLSTSLRTARKLEDVFIMATKRINASLNMQKTILLLEKGCGKYYPYIMQGYTVKEKETLMKVQLDIKKGFQHINNPILSTKDTDKEYIRRIRKLINLPYFISTPIVVENKISGIFITGRMEELDPFLPRLNYNDVEAIQAVATLIASSIMYQKLDEATRKASTDALTGLYNRMALEQKIVEKLEKHNEKSIAVFILMDIDYFKNVNDCNGHMIGDHVLKTLAKTLKSAFRSTDIISRFGGDEFVVVAKSVNNMDAIISRIERFLDHWRNTIFYNNSGDKFYSTLSVGISCCPQDGISYSELLHKADIALYNTKENGRNGYSIYDEKTMKNISCSKKH